MCVNQDGDLYLSAHPTGQKQARLGDWTRRECSQEGGSESEQIPLVCKTEVRRKPGHRSGLRGFAGSWVENNF